MSNPLFQLHAEVLDAATAEVALWRETRNPPAYALAVVRPA